MKNYAAPLLAAFLPILAACAGQTNQTLPSAFAGGTNAKLVQPHSGSNLIMDGSFETPTVPSGSYTLFGKGQHFGGWTVYGTPPGNVAVVSDTFVFGGYSFPAGCGHQLLDLTGTSNSRNGVNQRIKTTSGSAYTIKFDVGNVYGSGDIGTSSTALVYVNGKKVFTATNHKGKGLTHIVWQTFSTGFTATSAMTRIGFINGDPPSDTANGLDCVSVTKT